MSDSLRETVEGAHHGSSTGVSRLHGDLYIGYGCEQYQFREDVINGLCQQGDVQNGDELLYDETRSISRRAGGEVVQVLYLGREVCPAD